MSADFIQDPVTRLDQIKELKAKLAQEEREVKAALKPKKYAIRAQYKCENCDCGGIIGKPDLVFLCGQHETNRMKMSKVELTKTWQPGKRKQVENNGQLTTDEIENVDTATLEEPENE